SRRRHTRSDRDWSSDVCSSDLPRIRRGKRPETIQLGKAWAKETVLPKQVLRYARVPRASLRMTRVGCFYNRENRREVRVASLRRSEERRVGKEGSSRLSE